MFHAWRNTVLYIMEDALPPSFHYVLHSPRREERKSTESCMYWWDEWLVFLFATDPSDNEYRAARNCALFLPPQLKKKKKKIQAIANDTGAHPNQNM